MPTMKKWLLLIACALFASAAAAQEFSEDPYEFILAKLAAQDGRLRNNRPRGDRGK